MMILKPTVLRAAPLLSRMMMMSSSSFSTRNDTIIGSSSADEVLKFWFEDLSPQQWFIQSDQVDTTIRNKFLDTHNKAAAGELDNWRKDARGSLAEIIILDQFSRNLYRNTPQAFAQDGMALVLAQEAIGKGFEDDLSTEQVQFLYLPFMHSESLVIHERAVELYTALGMNLEFEMKHKAIIERFGRYPHRNAILERESTPEEIEFLKGPDSSF
ncbi:DUF924 domain-containing protein [Skeletonema marinoi]|uniref:DUF924 domain-containing protein n=1 Tax=Skeletonema marinoi TaxID=267567 RepID=A0AAD9D993_9STRA|nr:DUF924 domain-containing protein [Skeletonema marinoi]